MEQKYIAFISYRHAPLDQAVAKELHSRIEQYTIPKGLRKDGKKLGRVFRDLEELPASSNLSDDIYRALDNSENLIVVCSREMAKSPWVAREVEYFLQHHSQDKVYTVLIDGEPGEVFPKPLLTKTLPGGAVVDVEPLAVDVRADSKAATLKKLGKEMNRLLAAMIGCPYDALVQRQQKRQRRRLLLGTGAVLAVALLFSGMMLVKNRQIDAKNEELEQTNQQLEQTNQQLEAQKVQLQLNESELLTNQANQFLSNGDLGLALPYAVDALSNADGSGRPYYAPAEKALISSLGIFDENGGYLLIDTDLALNTPVVDFCISEDGAYLVTVDQYGQLFCFDTATGEGLWSDQAENESRLLANGMQLVVETGTWAAALDFATGNVLWCADHIWGDTVVEVDTATISPDGTRLVCTGSYLRDNFERQGLVVLVMDTATGETLGQMELVQGQSMLSEARYPFVQLQNVASVSSDGRYLAGCWDAETSATETALHFYLADLENMTWKELYSVPVERYSPADQVHAVHVLAGHVYVLRGPQTGNGVAILEAWNIAQERLVWSTECDAGEQQIFLSRKNCQVVYSSLYCAFSIDDQLFWLDRATGQVFTHQQADADVVLLELSESGIYRIGLANGRFGYVWLNSLGSLTTRMPATLYPAAQMQTHGESFLALPVEDGTVGEAVPTDSGFTAYVYADDPSVVVITKAVNAGAYFPETQVQVLQESDRTWLSSSWELADGRVILGPITLASGEAPYQRFLLLDPENPQQQTSLYAGSQYASADDLYFTADGKYCLECESNGNIRWYDTATGQETVLSQRETKELGSLADVTYTYSRYLSAACNRKDGVLMAVRLEENGMTLWLDGQEKYVEAPDGAPLQMAMGAVTGRQLAVGTSGHVLVSGFADEQDAQMDFLWCYDSLQDSWSRLDVPTELLGCKVWVGSENRAVVVDMEANLFVLNLTTGRLENQTELLFPLSAIAQMELVLEDQYLMVRTQDKQLIICDPEEETLLYYQTLAYHNQLTATYDGAGRLYISWENGGICIQTDSWQLLTEIPDMLCYHVQTGRILQSRYVYTSDGLEQMLVLKQMPDTDSLIGIAKALLGRT